MARALRRRPGRAAQQRGLWPGDRDERQRTAGTAAAPGDGPGDEGGSGPPAPPSVGTEPRTIDDACPPEAPEDGFQDLPQDNSHERAVDCIVWWGVASGRSSTSYAPSVSVTREQMATFVARAIVRAGGDLPLATRDHFTDDNGSRHEDSINRLAEAGIVTGRGAGVYAPDLPVLRDAMATFLVRAVQHRTGRALPDSTDHFLDDNGNTHEPNIDRAAGAGVTGGTGPGA